MILNMEPVVFSAISMYLVEPLEGKKNLINFGAICITKVIWWVKMDQKSTTIIQTLLKTINCVKKALGT